MAADLRLCIEGLERVLALQEDQLRHGDADGVADSARLAQEKLARLMAAAAGRPLPDDERGPVQRLLQRSRAMHAMLARRQQQIEDSLRVLGASSDRMRDHQLQRVYAASGGLGGSALRSTGFARA
jgi:hypothetical protein